MCEPKDSSQIQCWTYTPEFFDQVHARANRVARKALTAMATEGSTSGKSSPTPSTEDSSRNTIPVESFARNFEKHRASYANEDEGPWQTSKGNDFLTPADEALLVSFYASYFPKLIGPQSQSNHLRKGNAKFPATGALLFRRFYLSNSVMVHDPKTMMVAAAFLASKVEDSVVDLKYLMDESNRLGAQVSQTDVLRSEVDFLSGIHFDLMCYHPYKGVQSFTEDLRSYLKSEKGRTLITWNNNNDRLLRGEDLAPIYEAAVAIVNDVVVSDIPLLYTPGQIGLAAMMVANERHQAKGIADAPQIDMTGYLAHRFDEVDVEAMITLMRTICGMLRELSEGKHGCANHKCDMAALKGIHKKLKKCRAWGQKEKKKSKRKHKDTEEGDGGPDSKRPSTGTS